MESWRQELYASDYGQTYLAHHGIEGQEWGRRRWQNKDGSLTPEGRKRYGVDDSEAGRKREGVIKNISNEIKNKEKALSSNPIFKKYSKEAILDYDEDDNLYEAMMDSYGNERKAESAVKEISEFRKKYAKEIAEINRLQNDRNYVNSGHDMVKYTANAGRAAFGVLFAPISGVTVGTAVGYASKNKVAGIVSGLLAGTAVTALGDITARVSESGRLKEVEERYGLR